MRCNNSINIPALLEAQGIIDLAGGESCSTSTSTSTSAVVPRRTRQQRTNATMGRCQQIGTFRAETSEDLHEPPNSTCLVVNIVSTCRKSPCTSAFGNAYIALHRARARARSRASEERKGEEREGTSTAPAHKHISLTSWQQQHMDCLRLLL